MTEAGWTRNVPTVNGWYWHTTPGSEVEPEIVLYAGDELVMLAGDGKLYSKHTMIHGSGLWLGPLTVPEVPK